MTGLSKRPRHIKNRKELREKCIIDLTNENKIFFNRPSSKGTLKINTAKRQKFRKTYENLNKRGKQGIITFEEPKW